MAVKKTKKAKEVNRDITMINKIIDNPKLKEEAVNEKTFDSEERIAHLNRNLKDISSRIEKLEFELGKGFFSLSESIDEKFRRLEQDLAQGQKNEGDSKKAGIMSRVINSLADDK